MVDTTTEGYSLMFKNGVRPVHPGELLREDFLKALGMSANALPKALHVPTLRQRRTATKVQFPLKRSQLPGYAIHKGFHIRMLFSFVAGPPVRHLPLIVNRFWLPADPRSAATRISATVLMMPSPPGAPIRV